MSRFILLENEHIDSNYESILKKRSYERQKQLLFKGNLFVRKKLKVQSCNSYFSTEGFIVGVGTYIYKNETGLSSLQLILKDFLETLDVAEIRKKIKGAYSFCICLRNEVYVFNDYYGLYDVYYGNNHNGYFIGNEVSDLSFLVDSIEINEFEFLYQSFVGRYNTKKSILKGIFKLLNNEYIHIKSGKIFITKIPSDKYKLKVPEFQNVTQAIAYVDTLVSNVVKDILKCFGSIDICITGGLDSRLILASFIREQNSVNHILYGESDNFYMFARNEDLCIAKKLSEISKTKLLKLNWSNPEYNSSIDLNWQKEFFEKVGVLNTVYLGNKNVVNSLMCNKDLNISFLEFGYFLDPLRKREWVDYSKRNNFSLDEYLNRILPDKKKIGYDNIDEFYNWVKEMYVDSLSDLNILDYSRIPIEYANIMEWFCRQRYTDSKMCVFVNNYTHSFPIFSVPEIHEFILKIPYDALSNAKFQIKLISTIYPELLKIKIFSHRRYYNINKRGERVLAFNMKNLVTRIGYKLPNIYRYFFYYYKKYHYKSTPSDNSLFMKNLFDLNVKAGGILNLENYKLPIFNLFKYRQLLLCILFMKNSKEGNEDN